jgi:hypothetical protein
MEDGYQRKVITPVALVTDAGNGFLFQPELGEPGQSKGEILARAILNAIEGGKRVPSELRVRQSEIQNAAGTSCREARNQRERGEVLAGDRPGREGPSGHDGGQVRLRRTVSPYQGRHAASPLLFSCIRLIFVLY